MRKLREIDNARLEVELSNDDEEDWMLDNVDEEVDFDVE